MPSPTLHTAFNKLILMTPISKGALNTPIQFSLYIPSIEKLQQNDIDYQRGELFQTEFDLFENFIKQRNIKDYFTYNFTKKAREFAMKEDICVYCFMLPNAKGNLAYAIATENGCQYIELMGKNDKQVSINQYIVNTLNQTGWF